jgi:hypothetical protein
MSYLTPFILFGLGVIIWRYQLSAKRRFEVAEQVLTAFQKAADGLSTLRNRFVSAHEIEKMNKKGEEQTDGEAPKTKSKKQQLQERRLEMQYAYAGRAEAISPAFAELRTAQILAEIHFGRSAADAIGVLFNSRQLVLGAVWFLYGHINNPADCDFPTVELKEKQQQREVSELRVLHELREWDGTPYESDQLSQRINAARTALESACRPFLADPPWLKTLSDALRRWRLG